MSDISEVIRSEEDFEIENIKQLIKIQEFELKKAENIIEQEKIKLKRFLSVLQNLNDRRQMVMDIIEKESKNV
jgi:hypothetical protein